MCCVCCVGLSLFVCLCVVGLVGCLNVLLWFDCLCVCVLCCVRFVCLV